MIVDVCELSINLIWIDLGLEGLHSKWRQYKWFSRGETQIGEMELLMFQGFIGFKLIKLELLLLC